MTERNARKILVQILQQVQDEATSPDPCDLGALADRFLERWQPAPRRATAEHDTEADAWYVRVLDEPVHHTTESAPANLDWTRDGRLIGVELLGPLRRDQAVPDGWYPAAMREHDRANAAELDRSAAARRAASWWEAAKTLNRWGTAHRELHRAALVEITNLTAVRDELAHQRDDLRARADAAEAKLRQVREVIAEDAETRARFNVDTSTSYGPRFLSRIRAIVDREPAREECGNVSGEGVDACTLPEGHELHRNPSTGTYWSEPQPDSETEWGCRDRHGQVHSIGVENETQARAMRSMTPVRREVGPWTEVQP